MSDFRKNILPSLSVDDIVSKIIDLGDKSLSISDSENAFNFDNAFNKVKAAMTQILDSGDISDIDISSPAILILSKPDWY